MVLADMNERIDIEKAVVSVDKIGNRTNTYVDYCSRWTYANMTTGGEDHEAGLTHEKETIKFVVRYDSLTKLITPGEYRIVFHSKIYNIVSVDNFKFRNETLTLVAEKEYD